MPYRRSPDDQPAQWACSDCGQRCSASGVCARCGEGPLLDLEDPNVVQRLIAQDEERADAKRRWKIAVALPFGLITACVTMFVPGHYRMYEVPVVAAPLAGLVVSLLVLVTLGCFAPPLQLWSSLVSQEKIEPVKGLRRSVFNEIGGGVLIVFGVIFLAILILVAVEEVAHRENRARERQLDVVHDRWIDLRKCLVARSGTPALRVSDEASVPVGNCDRQTSTLYTEAKKYPGEPLRIVEPLENIARCKRRCEMPPLDDDAAFAFRRASYEFDYNASYVATEPRL